MANPNDVPYSLSRYYNGNESNDQGAWSQFNPTTHVPRTYIPGDEASASGSNNWEEESNSNYTHTTRSSRTHTTRSASLFSRRSTAAQSSVGQSTAPSSRRTAYAGAEPVREDSGDFFLWCEFYELKGCTTTFQGDDEAAWIQHHIRHLKERFPRELVCWFCDDHPRFIANGNADRQSNFLDRMQHIREHISGDYATFDGTRPDFYMVKHMYEIGRIDKDTFEMAMGYSEVPQSYQLPDGGDESRTSSGAVYHNLRKEEKELRRQRKQGGKKGGHWHA